MLSLAKARKDYYLRKVGEISHRDDYYLRCGSATGRWHGEVSAPSDTPKQQTVELPERTPPDRPAMTGRVDAGSTRALISSTFSIRDQ